ncbi:MAG: superoxide dismutase [Phycisphaerales bacterium]|nr:superoxide dismutase [Phycisphaerales bacterium]
MPSPISRRDAVIAIAAAAAAPRVLARSAPLAPAIPAPSPLGLELPVADLTLPPLPYAFNALEPFIDAETMEIHHDRHHKAYIDNANKALAGTPWADKPAGQIIANLEELPDDKRTAIRNNLGGHVNHAMFWTLMAPPSGGTPGAALSKAITSAFNTFDGFKEKFAAAAASRFGSGWAWLVVKGGALAICSTANQDTPLMGEKIAGCAGTPILGLDVWEHAYYLKYRNKRADYITAWWNVVNWPAVEARYAEAMK